MEFKYYESRNYRSLVNEAANEAPSRIGEATEVLEERAAVLSSIESATGLRFGVAVNGVAANVAAFVQTGSRRAFVSEGTLDDLRFATYAAHHEAEHLRNGVFGLDVKANVPHEGVDAIGTALGISDWADEDLVEGFNDWGTILKVGRNEKSGYLEVEVPLAQKLEALCLKWTGASLRQAFSFGNVELFFERLRFLGELLLMNGRLARAA